MFPLKRLIIRIEPWTFFSVPNSEAFSHPLSFHGGFFPYYERRNAIAISEAAL